MPESGGSTTQSGILFQNSVTALYLGRLLDTSSRLERERISQVRVEAPTEVDDTVITFADLHCAYIQSKEHLRVNSSEWKTLWLHFDKQFRYKEFRQGQDQLILYIGFGLQDHYELQGLCERAAKSPTFTEWQQSRLSQVQTRLVESIIENFSPEGLTNQYYHQLLAHTIIEICPQTAIERDRLRDWIPYTNRTQFELFRLLRDRVGGEARVKGIFEAQSLRQSLLAESPDIRFNAPIDIDVLRQAIRQCSSLLRQHRNTITGTDIYVKRESVNSIVEWLLAQDDNRKSVSMLLDQAGMGKTVVTSEVLSELERRKIDVVAIKADQQLSDIKILADVQSKLELPYSIEQVVGRLAQLDRVVVLIDQIDALSLSLAHDQAALNITLDLVARLRSIPNVRILLSCREFDRKADPRLNKIETGQTFTLSKFSVEQVQEVVAALQIDFDQLTATTQELLRIPLHLDLLARAVHESDIDKEELRGISSLQELYALIWRYVVVTHEASAPPAFERLKVINKLTDYMDSWQRTTAPQSLLQTSETQEQAVIWLASRSIIVQGNTEWIFFHQTFFDYWYARRFIENDNDIVGTIANSRQGIFERSKLLQVIAYLRSHNHSQYISELDRLFNHSDLRVHLYDLLLRWFGALPNPTDDEWLVARLMLQNSTRFSQVLISMYGQEGWFRRLRTVIPTWLTDEERRAPTLNYLGSMIEVVQAEISLLLAEYLDKGEEWNVNVARILSHVRNWHTTEAINLYERTVYELPILQRSTWWQLHSVCKVAPETGCRLLRYIFDAALKSYEEECVQEAHERISSVRFSFVDLFDEFRAMEHDIKEALKETSARSAAYFVELFIPWVEKLFSVLPAPPNDHEWFESDPLSHGWYNNSLHIKNLFIQALIAALTQVACDQPEMFRPIAERLTKLPFETPQLLLTHIYRALPEAYIEDAFTFLISDQRRLNLGDQAQYDSRQFIQSIYPYLFEAQRIQLETHICNYAPIYKSHGLQALRWRGIEQYRLLSSIPENLLSPLGQHRLYEWQRKFPDVIISDKLITTIGGLVGSPIEAERAIKMSNRNWLYAMSKYQKAVQHKDFLKGGARELSQVLSAQIKDDPERFYKLFHQLPSELDEAYVSAFISGFAGSTAPSEWVFEVFRRYARQNGLENKRELSRAIQERAKSKIPDDVIIDKLMEWVHESIEDDELWWTKGNDHGDPYSSYLNSDRGAAFLTLMRVFDARDNEQAYEKKWELIEFVSKDPSTALRIGAIHELTYMIQHDRSKTWTLFEQLLTGHEVLLANHHVREFLYWSLSKNFLNLQPYIEQMMNHTNPEVQEMGAGLACIAAISKKVMESDDALQAANLLAEKAITGQPAHRRGAAHIYGYNMVHGSEQSVRLSCAQLMQRLVNDDDQEVRNNINQVFLSLKENSFLELRNFIEDVALAESYPLDYQFAKCLWEYGMLDPEWTIAVIDIVLSKASQPERWDPCIEEIMRFVLRVYTSNLVKEEIKEKAMDIFDILTKNFSSSTNKILAEWDRR